MINQKNNILSTRPIDENLVNKAIYLGFNIDIVSFIETASIVNEQLKFLIEEITLQEKYIVFTSMNAVESVNHILQNKETNWKIYCIGNSTKKLVTKYFGEDKIISTAKNAFDLAHEIIQNKLIKEVCFFCAKHRRDELPNILQENKIDVKEFIVYETIQIKSKVNKDYQGILFFSPSAVESFFSANSINTDTILFAIGATTSAEIKKYSSNKIIVSNQATKENLFHEMMIYFSNKKNYDAIKK